MRHARSFGHRRHVLSFSNVPQNRQQSLLPVGLIDSVEPDRRIFVGKPSGRL